MESLKTRMVSGAAWMIAVRLLDRAIGILSTLILARLLVPADFGLVAMATVIGGLLELLGAFSFDMALIQHPKAERRHYDTVWTFSVMFGLFFAAALLILAVPVSHFYAEPRLQGVMLVLAACYVIGGFNNVGVVAFRKELDFRREFNFIAVRRLVTFVITIGLAWTLQSYWALLGGILAGRSVNLIMSYTMHPYRPRLSLAAGKELFHFSKWLLLNNLLIYLMHNGCSLVIGRTLGPGPLGVFSVYYEICILPSTELVAPINRATFPALSRMREQAEIARTYLQVFGILALVILPVGIGISAVAHPLIHTLLGERWLVSTVLMQMLAIHGTLAALQGNNGVVWLAMGHPRLTALMCGLFLLILGPALYFCMKRYGIDGAGYAYLIANGIVFPISMYMAKHQLALRWKELGRTVWRPLLGVALMWACVAALLAEWHSAYPLLRLVAACLGGALVYCASVLLLWRMAGKPAGAETFILRKLPFRRFAVQLSN